jgi:7-cyano-7-deazaguanine synthase
VSQLSQRDGRPAVAVLVSGGLDSAVLVASEAREHDVQPIYVSCGLPWEAVEKGFLSRFLSKYRVPHALLPLVELELPIRDVYPPSHWALSGAAPAYDTADADVYLVGRNIAILGKAGIYCAVAGVNRLVTGQLQGNPFPDATPEFFSSMARTLSLGLNQRLEIASPFLSKSKADVIRLGVSLEVPFALTVSCMNPTASAHCGACSKCRERREGFAASGIPDPTAYSALPERA